ncbi:TPA: hypothetical protein ENG04_07990 [Candidatus Poribacteria bacterium]|nr:hypothetical protein [Candidatus Poribacteria bacterium]HEX30005.1 hypothetical protein [Candidatus Poribacteria bacterium]
MTAYRVKCSLCEAI